MSRENPVVDENRYDPDSLPLMRALEQNDMKRLESKDQETRRRSLEMDALRGKWVKTPAEERLTA